MLASLCQLDIARVILEEETLVEKMPPHTHTPDWLVGKLVVHFLMGDGCERAQITVDGATHWADSLRCYKKAG